MMYCAVSEAYNGDPTTRLDGNDRQVYNTNHNNNNIIMPDTFDNYSDIDVHQKYLGNEYNNDFNQMNPVNQVPQYPAFFTAQGDYSTKGPYYGTTINDLKGDNISIDDSLSILDSDYSDDSLFDPSIMKNKTPETKKKIDHNYYINKTIKSLLEDQDSHSFSSLASSQNNYIYKHVKSCKYCKDKINKKMKEHFIPEISKPIQQITNNPDIKEYFDMTNLGYDLKEILIIILAGIVLIFILDLLVKIGRRMK
jgi:hypothetical protein